ncbi:hypothetical protein H4Q26_004576 [Puccinia striiformis f. sp. tritici PST-130]|nr:hypothetical protein H4Q26_004576 [Puccinia striiformis f. sp. tritici PST-130]
MMETTEESIPIRNIMKSNARRKRRQNDRHSEYSLEIQASGINGQKVVWSIQKYRQCHLYPAIRAEKKNPPRRPTAENSNKLKISLTLSTPSTMGKLL